MNPETIRKMKNRALTHLAVLLVLLTAVLNGACAKDDGPGGEAMNLSELSLPEEVAGKTGDRVTIGGRGFRSGDELRLKSVLAASLDHVAPIVEITDTSLTFLIPEGLSDGEYKIYLYRGEVYRLMGRIRFSLVSDVPDVQGMNLKGCVTCEGKPVVGVAVSDGISVTRTDAAGRYYLRSDKRNGYVFISVPGGYETATDKTRPQFYKYLDASASVTEQRDFRLTRRANERHRVVVFSDVHLANRVSDLRQFDQGFHAELAASLRRSHAEGLAIYGIALGDLAWDQFWYDNRFDLNDYHSRIGDLDLPIFSVPGNHDNDRKTVGDDFAAATPFRTILGPTDYSFNLGKVHYILLDDIVYLNAQGDGSFENRLTEETLTWLRADLETVDESTPIVLGMHIPLFKTPERGKAPAINLQNGAELIELLKAYDVNVISGHAHTNFNLVYSDRLREHNIAAVCATWWWTGHTGHAGNHICRDGSPGGYKVFDIDGERIVWRYKGIGKADDYQFRVYDLNRCRITRAEHCPNPQVTDAIFSKYAGSYDAANERNEALINVFDWSEEWRIEVRDLGDGAQLTPEPVRVHDPLHIVSYNMTRLNRGGSTAVTFPTSWTEHAFRVTSSSATSTLEVTVTDGFGNRYVQRVERPKALEYAMN